ncbi:SRPBCC family protein [Fibrella sp. HMF5335]|uniref:SRPBCC family protein n=1 Tax=Fibrella rubiginis TaxID=2817060 RepID=A0A939GLE0_9BACT|nr:SRPBCC family protein [Fibrella rubiginis]MBO0939479.1 SRPBCC family protein [Fibrella rubiginis]
MISLGETVTWRARYFGIYQTLTVQITAIESPVRFVDQMLSGAFASMHHTHLFEPHSAGTRMIDMFDYTSPLGPLGLLADWLFLKRYMTNLLRQRNSLIKQVAENAQGL